MNNSKKGVTLVEILVAIAVFSIISLALFSSVFAMGNIISRQEEYVKLEMVCYDISFYREKYGSEWHTEYFTDIDTSASTGYLSSDFKPTTLENAVYIIEFTADEIISISAADSETVFIENVSLPIRRTADENE